MAIHPNRHTCTIVTGFGSCSDAALVKTVLLECEVIWFFFFLTRNIDESVKASQVSAAEEKCKKMTTKGASHERAESEARSQRQDQSSSTKHAAEREHPAGCRRASQSTGPFFVKTVVSSSMSFVMTPHAVSRPRDMKKTSKSNKACTCESTSPAWRPP